MAEFGSGLESSLEINSKSVRRPFKLRKIFGESVARDPNCHVILKWPQTLVCDRARKMRQD